MPKGENQKGSIKEMEKAGLGLEITELRLGLPGGGTSPEKNEKKRNFEGIGGGKMIGGGGGGASDGKDQLVVGWPPVCSYRRKNGSFGEREEKVYVKVRMDGAPILRKIDLRAHKGYDALAAAFEELFDGSAGIREALKDANGFCEYVPIYEDKDGDWMLIGDVPWEMFVESCKRLRIMKKSDARGFGLHQRNKKRCI